MKIIRPYHLSLFLLLLLVLDSSAQSSDTSGQKNRSQFKFSINYNSNLNYYGRTDSLRSSGFFPLIEIWFTQNLYMNAAPVFVHNAVSSFDYAGTVTTVGYQFNTNRKFLGNIYFLKPFYERNSQLVQSALKAQSGANFTLLNKALNLTVGGDIKFSDKTDFGTTTGLDHIFRVSLPAQAILVFDPSAYLYAGTQQFTKTYYKKSSFLLFPGYEQQITENVKQFNVLAYEFNMPVIFAKGKFQFLFTPAYVIPQNLITIPDRMDLSERGKRMFYATIGGKIIL